MFPFNDSLIKKIRSVRPDRLIELWPQNEPVGHGVSTGVIRGYHGAYTATNLGQPGIQGSGLTSAGYDGATSFNNIHTAGFANDNQIGNPGFETPGAMPPVWAGWLDTLGDGAIANEVVIVHEGLDAAKLTAGIARNTSTSFGFVTVPGERMRLRLWSQGDGVNDGQYQVYDVTHGVDIVPTANTGITVAVWGMVEAEFTVPAGCISTRLFLRCPNVNGGVAYFDATEVRRIDGFLGDKGSIVVPAQVANAGVWADGILRYLVNIATPSSSIFINCPVGVNSIHFRYTANGAVSLQTTGGLANVDFASYGMTWDVSAGATGEVRYYINGVASGPTDAAIGTWLGDVNPAACVLGASSTVPANVWSGNIAPVPIWSEALSPDEMRYLGT